MKYKVITRCFYQKKVYDSGEIVELDPSQNPPKHFVLLSDYKEPDKSKNDPMAPKPMSFGQPVKMSAGFAAKLEAPVPQPMQTAPKKTGRSRKT